MKSDGMKIEAAGRLDDATRRAGGDTMPPQLRQITVAHAAKLQKLVETLRAAGVEDSLVRHSVRELIQSYEEELVEVVTSIARELPQ